MIFNLPNHTRTKQNTSKDPEKKWGKRERPPPTSTGEFTRTVPRARTHISARRREEHGAGQTHIVQKLTSPAEQIGRVPPAQRDPPLIFGEPDAANSPGRNRASPPGPYEELGRGRPPRPSAPRSLLSPPAPPAGAARRREGKREGHQERERGARRLGRCDFVCGRHHSLI